MNQIFFLSIILLSVSAHGQQLNADEWDEEAKTNIRLLPKYGLIQKTEDQKKSDQNFIEETVQLDKFKGDRTAASNHMISLGFTYLYRGDYRKAMHRFNQAYLLDSLNSDIYWGYGAVYMTLGKYEKAREQYEDGLSQNPQNTHLLTDYGTYFMAQYFPMVAMPANEFVANPKEQAENLLESALRYLNQSYQLDRSDQNTTYKLSTSYFYKGDCDNTWKYYDECRALGGQPITDDFTKDLKRKCKKRK